MNESLLVAGIVCIVASIVGGGVKLLGAEVPVLNSFARQALLFTVGLAFLAASYLTSLPRAARTTPTASAIVETPAAPAAVAMSSHSEPVSTPPSSGCSPSSGLACLPASSHAAVFANAPLANAAAWRDYLKGMSTTAGAAAAESQGATGKAARSCGIIASSDSSGLGKHLAALALSGHTVDGSATPACLIAASAYL